jgi:hypothetical protein
LLAQQRLQPYRVSAQEIADLWAVVDGSIADAQVDRISLDLRFSAAYDAALTLANMALRCAGFRTRGVAHHATAFAALPLVMGQNHQGQADLFEACRTKRNVGHYQRRGQITPQELGELLEAVRRFREDLRGWMRQNRPQYVPQALQ